VQFLSRWQATNIKLLTNIKLMTKLIISTTVIAIVLLFLVSCTNQKQPQKTNTITISGQVTDFEGNPIDSSVVRLMHQNFTVACETYTDKSGNYILKDVEKGQYMAMFAMRPKEYPRENAISEEDMRLEFWAWNVIADKDLTINPRYHRLELYGFTVFEVRGGYPGLMAYVRPMSLGKSLSYTKTVYLDKSKAEKTADISINLEDITFQIYAGNELLKINSIQKIIEFEGENQPINR
jgi:hypothetical protein